MKVSVEKAGVALLSVATLSAVAGVIAGILIAPKSGAETRKDLKEKASKIKEQINTEVIPQVKKEYKKAKKAVMNEINTRKTKKQKVIKPSAANLKKAV